MFNSRFAPLACLVALACTASAAPCTAPQILVERFVSAQCTACWRAVPPLPAASADAAFVLDWVVPAQPDAPLGAMASPEASVRAARSGGVRDDEAMTQTTPLAARSALQLQVEDGPAWNGYIGVQLQVRATTSRPLPTGLAVYLALVERIAPGEDGSPVARQLVRAVVGPLPLDGLADGRVLRHLRALRVPETPKPERLSAVGWLETPAGRVLAIVGADAGHAACSRSP
jgi:hypothetical protein